MELVRKQREEVTIAGGQVSGDEWAEHVVKHRSGIILRARWADFSSLKPLSDPLQHSPQV